MKILSIYMGQLNHILKVLVLFVFLCLYSLVSQAGPKTDTVYLYNGDRITGEVKKFEYGILFFKTDGMGTLNIEFDKIRTFYSAQQLTVQMENGLRFLCSVDTSGNDGYVNLQVRSFRIPEDIINIVEIYPVKRAFWKRLDGAIDIGYSYTKASTVSQLNFSGNIDYRVQKSFTQIIVNSTFTDQQDKDRIRKQDYVFNFNHFFKTSWYGASFLGVQQNTEIGNDMRAYGGLGIGKDIIHNNLNVFTATTGVLISTERSESDSLKNSVEGVAQLTYRIFKFNKPDVDVTSLYNFYPSFTSKGRYRMEFEIKAKIEIFNDFYFGLSFYDNFDSKPLDPTAATNDWGVITSFGYTW